MTRPRLAGLARLGAAWVAILALAGCSASVSTGGPDSDEIAEEAQAQLSRVSTQQGGAPFPKVECPDDLDEEVGATTTCFAHYNGARQPISVEVTKVTDENVSLDFNAKELPEK